MAITDIYAKQKVGPGLLSIPGRVLFCLMEDAEMTRLSLSLLLGVSESAIDKAIVLLEDQKILSVSRNGRKSRYAIDYNQLSENADFRAILEMRVNEQH